MHDYWDILLYSIVLKSLLYEALPGGEQKRPLLYLVTLISPTRLLCLPPIEGNGSRSRNRIDKWADRDGQDSQNCLSWSHRWAVPWCIGSFIQLLLGSHCQGNLEDVWGSTWNLRYENWCKFILHLGTQLKYENSWLVVQIRWLQIIIGRSVQNMRFFWTLSVIF